MNIDVLVARVEKVVGHTDFCREPFTGSEHTYKRELSTRTQKLLGRDALNQLIAQEKWADVCQRVAEVFKHRYGLARWNEYQWVRYLNAKEQHQFTLALNRFLHGAEPFLERLERFVDEATEVYNRFQERDTEQQKRYTRTTLTWPFVSYFHFMLCPDQEYVFIKPSFLREATKAAEFDLDYRSAPNPETYASVQEFYRALWPTVQGMGGRDWIDVQSLIHIAGGGYGKLDDSIPSSLDPEKLERLLRWKVDGQAEQGHHFSFLETRRRLNAIRPALQLLKDSSEEFTEAEWQIVLDHMYAAQRQKTNILQKNPIEDVRRELRDFLFDDETDLTTRFERCRIRNVAFFIKGELIGWFDPNRYPIYNGAALDGLKYFGFAPDEEKDYVSFKQTFEDFAEEYERHIGQLHPDLPLYAEIDQLLYHIAITEVRRPDRLVAEDPRNGERTQLRKPPSPPLAPILARIEESIYVFSDEIITNYHLSLLTKPFVILTGLSGTGKTKLTGLYADAVYDIKDGQPNPYYAIVAVRPDWTDNRGLLGYYNPLTRTYEATPFLRFVLQAAADPGHWYYLCLDEMNLARVEYYFSDFLSAMESGEPIALHGQEGSVATQAGEDIVATLPIADMSWGYIVDDVLYIPPSLPIPPNLALSGTVNVDETTHAFSDKVLDRANSIEFNRTDLDRYAQRYRERFPERVGLVDEVLPLLRRVYDLLEPRYLHFGYRTLEEVLGYLWQNETLPDDVRRERIEVLDHQLMQKVLPKLRGDERIGETLEKLRDELKGALGEESRSVVKLNWMIEELSTFGSTQFWR